MSKINTLTKLLRFVSDAGLKAFLILALLVGGFYAYAQITWPTQAPNAVSGIVGMFVGESKSAFTVASSYADVNKYCNPDDGSGIKDPDNQTVLGAHVCTQDEMINSYNHGTKDVSAIYKYQASKTLWINSGAPGYTANSNDCKGWSSITSPSGNRAFGRVWNFDDNYGGLLDCKTGKKFACCK